MTDAEIDAHLAFLRAAEALKDTIRSGRTRRGRRESTAEHTWRLCLMAVTLEERFAEIDMGRLLRLLIVHDLGEAVSGDIPAPDQIGDKSAEERADMVSLVASLPEPASSRLMDYWDEYAASETPEARLAKGAGPARDSASARAGGERTGFRFAFNLAYGRDGTDAHPVTRVLRGPIDALTARLAGVALPPDSRRATQSPEPIPGGTTR